MSITDELREFIDSLACHNDTRDMMRRIADRIDKEHAEAVADALQLRGEPDRWVELPVDADGVPIHVGDVMEWPDGSTFDVVGISANTLFYVEHDFDDSAQWTAAHDKRHHQPDSWERIIEDAVKNGMYDHDNERIQQKLVERCRRLAGDAG